MKPDQLVPQQWRLCRSSGTIACSKETPLLFGLVLSLVEGAAFLILLSLGGVTFPKAQKVHERVRIAFPGRFLTNSLCLEAFGKVFC